MQPRLAVEVLILKSERLMGIGIDFLFFFQAAPSIILPRPQQVAELVGLLPWYADLIIVEIGEVLSFVLVVAEDLG